MVTAQDARGAGGGTTLRNNGGTAQDARTGCTVEVGHKILVAVTTAAVAWRL